MLNFILFFDI